MNTNIRLVLILLVVGVMFAVFLTGPASHAGPDSPDIAALVDRVEQERLREHVDAIDEPRNAFAQPEALQRTADYIQGALEGYGYPVRLEPVTFSDATSPNIIAVQEGASCSERVFIVGAHYDSVDVTPGADDDASGVAAMLEIARVLADTRLPATVWFTGFTMEENGLVGSFNMAQDAADAGLEIVGMYSLEMIGYTTEESDFIVILGNTASVRLTDAYRRAQEAHVPELPSVIANVPGNGEEQRDSRRSDNAPFWDRGYQAMMVTDTANFRNPNYHEPSDTIDTLDFDFMTDVAKAMLATTVEYLTYDGDGDGEADACSGPLIATPTDTPLATAAPSEPVGESPTPTLQAPVVDGLPETGGGAGDGGPASLVAWPLVAGALVAGALAVLAAALVARRSAQRPSS